MKTLWQTYWKFVHTATYHRSELVTIQWLRGIAMMMVFVYHVEDILNLLPGWENFYSGWKMYGYAGPDIFFVISGYIMCFVTFEMPFKPMSWLVRRVARIYPIYLVFGLTAVAVWVYNPVMTMGSGPQTWGSVIKFLLIFPQENLPLLFVGWTLEHEMVFYAIVFVVASLKGKSRAVVVVTGIFSALAIVKWALEDNYPWMNFWDYHFFSLYMLQFFMGTLIFELRHHLYKLGVEFPMIAGLTLFALAGIICTPAPLNDEHLLKILMFGGAACIISIGWINWEMRKRERIGDYIDYKRRPFFVQMGDASYSIYLSHAFCLSICGKLILFSGLSGVAALIAMLTGATISLLIGCLVYHLIEKPMLHTSKMLLSSRKHKKPAEPSAAVV